MNLVKLAGFVAVPLAIWTTIAWVGVGACIALWRTETIEDTMEVLYTASTTHDDLNDDFSSSIEPKTNSSSHPSSIASLVPLVLPLLLSIALFLNSPFITRTPPPPNEDGPYGTTLFSLTSSPSLTTFCSNLSSTPSLPFPSSSSHQRKTALASHPRSGNTLLRELVERVTGWQTSSVYCDKSLMLGEGGFKGECDHESGWFVKTHFPRVSSRRGREEGREEEADARDGNGCSILRIRKSIRPIWRDMVLIKLFISVCFRFLLSSLFVPPTPSD